MAVNFNDQASSQFIVAVAGNNSYRGTAAFNYLDYRNSPGPITVNFLNGTVKNGWGGTDTFDPNNIEGIYGSSYADIVISRPGGKGFMGLAGDDRFVGYPENNPQAYLQYNLSPAAVYVDLQAGYALDGSGGRDTFTDVRHIEGGSRFGDTLLGSDLDDTFEGFAGDNVIDGRGGVHDISLYGAAPNDVTVDLAAGYAINGFGGRDTLANIEDVLGSRHNDTLLGSAGDNYLEGGPGNDVIDGRDGYDSVGFNSAVSDGIIVNLKTGKAYDGSGGVDTIKNVETVLATSFADILITIPTSTDVPKGTTMIASDGNDVIVSNAGNNIIDAGNGFDTVVYDGNRSSYRLRQNADATFDVDKPDGRDFLRGVERIQFNDGLFDTTTGSFDSSSPRRVYNSGSITLGTNAADRINGGASSEHIEGMDGLDVVVFSVNRSAIKLDIRDSVAIVTIGSGDHILMDVERLQLADVYLGVDIQGNSGSAYRMYQAAFNRTPDKGGVSFWTSVLDRGNSLDVVAQGFVKADEFKGVYGTNPSNSKVVDLFYQNVLGRPGETEGRNFWIGTLDAGASVATVLKGFANSPENHARVDPVIAQGIALDQTAFLV